MNKLDQAIELLHRLDAQVIVQEDAKWRYMFLFLVDELLKMEREARSIYESMKEKGLSINMLATEEYLRASIDAINLVKLAGYTDYLPTE